MIFVKEKQHVFYNTNIQFSGAFARLRKATTRIGDYVEKISRFYGLRRCNWFLYNNKF
jgi:hypothetical protein